MKSRDAGLVTFLGAFALSIVLVGGGLLVGNKHYVQKMREQRRQRAAVVAGEAILFVPLVATMPGPDDPGDRRWDRAPVLEVPVNPQNLAMPILARSTVKAVRLQAMTNGRNIAWRLSWPDPSADMNVDTGRFGDAVALQFPLAPDASYMMGGPEKTVQILQWKALWQKDLDEHFQDVQDLHPNYWTDLYWFARGDFPQRVPDDFGEPESRQWFAAHQAGNPVAAWDRRQPVEELFAEGFGTLTHQPSSATAGRGSWRDGWWTVVLVRPLRTDDPLDYQVPAEGGGLVGLAVWEGASGNVGGRKHFSNWVRFQVES